MIDEDKKELFQSGLQGEFDDALVDIELEIRRLQKYYLLHKETLHKLTVFMDLCDLAQDLKERMQDPNRLFKNRGKAMLQEEQDKKKVNSIPRRKQELLGFAEHKGNIVIHDELMSMFVEDHARLYEELFPPPASRSKNLQSSSLSSGKSGKSFSTSMRSNKTASPRSTKKLGKYHTSPAARRHTSRTLKTTPQSTQVSGSSRTDIGYIPPVQA